MEQHTGSDTGSDTTGSCDFEIIDHPLPSDPPPDPPLSANAALQMASSAAAAAATAAATAAAAAAEGASSATSSMTAALSKGYDAMRNPFTGAYTQAELDQFTAAQALYIDTVLDGDAGATPLWLSLTPDGSHPAYTGLSRGELICSSWIRAMGSSLLRPIAEEIVSLVCGYEAERSARLAGSGYPDDPTHCVCAELKAWARDSLSHMAPDPHTRSALAARLAYLNGLLDARVFPPGRSSATTMSQLLLAIVTLLEDRVLPLVNAHLVRASAREHLAALSRHANAFLSRVCQYLFYVLRDTPDTPPNIGVSHLMGVLDNSTELDTVLDSASGEALMALVHAPPVRAALDGAAAAPSLSLPLSTTSFVASSSTALANTTLTEPSVDPLPKRTAPIEFVATLSSRHAKSAGIALGIAAPFTSEPVLHAFAYLHVTAQELALLSILFARAQSLTGLGGDLLLYGLARSELEDLIASATTLVASIRSHLRVLTDETRSYARAMIRQRISDPAASVWRNNYDQISHITPLLTSSLDSFTHVLRDISASIDSFNLRDGLTAAKAAAAAFAQQSAAFVHDTHVLLTAGDPTL